MYPHAVQCGMKINVSYVIYRRDTSPCVCVRSCVNTKKREQVQVKTYVVAYLQRMVDTMYG